MSSSLADLTTLRLGGPASRVVTASTTAAVVEAVRAADAAGEPVLVVGGGSNLVVADAGWPGVVVLVRSAGITRQENLTSTTLTADAGVPWDDLVADSVRQGLSGLASMSGIPGLTGATPVQNVGAYGCEVAEVITSLRVLDRDSGQVQTWDAARCNFGFRTSAFKHTDRFVVLTVSFELPRSPLAPPVRYAELANRLGIAVGGCAESTAVRAAVLHLRRSKGMVLDPDDHDTWSVGSFFVNPIVDAGTVPAGCPHWPVGDKVKLSAAWLIENAGFGKGFGTDRGTGTVAVSRKHTLALTNRGGATTAELLELAAVIRAGVEQRFGVRLRPEAHVVGVQF